MLRALSLLFLVNLSRSQFTVPDVKLEAFSPKGFRASIPDTPGVQMFAFHGKKNAPLNTVEPGEFNEDITKPINNFWTYYNPDIQLRVGDTIHYWIFVQHNRLGYRRDELKFIVEELIPEEPLKCVESVTRINNGQIVCQGTLIFEDYFNNLNKDKWMINHYIPKRGPNYEFNTYENKADIIGIVDAKLRIKPRVKSEIRGILDLKNGCTSNFEDECYHQQATAFFIPPVTSGKLTSKFSFKYGKVEIRAKLPKGDWIFPEIFLGPRDDASPEKLLIAYARGNENLVGNDREDLGGRLLFAGPTSNATEPARSKNLKSYRHTKPLSDEMHTYVLNWEPGMITSYIDNKQFGRVYPANFGTPFTSEYIITLGIAVGGVNDFPDGFTSGGSRKPWINKDRLQVKKFFDSRNEWLTTWIGDDCSLQVEYIKVYAI